MPRVLKAAEEHGDVLYEASTEEDLGKAALVILEERLIEAVYSDEDDRPWASQASDIIELRKQDEDLAGKAAWRFLQLRKDYEYEYVTLEYTR